MKDCVVSKLKASVNNSQLEKLGIIEITISVTSSDQLYVFRASEDDIVQMKIISAPLGGQIQKYVSSDTREDLGQSCFLKNEDSGGYYFSVVGSYKVQFTNKNYITAFVPLNATADLSSFSYMTDLGTLQMGNSISGDLKSLEYSFSHNLKQLNLSNCENIDGDLDELSLSDIVIFNCQHSERLKGSISTFSGNTKIQTLVLCGKNVYGDIANIAGCSALSNCQMGNSGISGSLASLINNGQLTNPNLSILLVTNTPNLTKNDGDIATLRSLGVSVYV